MSNQATTVQPIWYEGAVLTAYGDESSDETKQRVFAMAGLFGTSSDWNRFEPKWKERTGSTTFHANECECDMGVYKDRPHKENQKLYADLTKLIAGSNLIGIGVAISLSDYTQVLARRFHENPYYVCFHSLIVALVRDSSYCVPRDKIEFIFDRNQEIEYNAGALYDRIVRTGPPEFLELMKDKVSFASRETVGIQAADLVAREAMKHMDNQIGPVRRQARLSFKALAVTKRIKFIALDKRWCDYMVRRSNEGLYPKKEYYDWLGERGRQNTFDNRLRYEDSRRSATGKIQIGQIILPTVIRCLCGSAINPQVQDMAWPAEHTDHRKIVEGWDSQYSPYSYVCGVARCGRFLVNRPSS